MITFSQFTDLDIRIGAIKDAERVPETDKLLRLEVDIGGEIRQIIAGIAEYYPEPRNLVGKQVPILANLEPKKMKGLESQGMLLAVSGHTDFSLLVPEKRLENGAQVR